jgi:hypothetical protein
MYMGNTDTASDRHLEHACTYIGYITSIYNTLSDPQILILNVRMFLYLIESQHLSIIARKLVQHHVKSPCIVMQHMYIANPD